MVIVTVGKRIEVDGLDEEASSWLTKRFEFSNPTFYKAKAMGRWCSEPATIKTWEECGPRATLSLPRGGMPRVRECMTRFDLDYEVRDERSVGDASKTGSHNDPWLMTPELFGPHKLVLWGHQSKLVDAIEATNQVLALMPTGSGKTSALLAAIARLQVPALVIMWDTGLLKQWQERVESELGIPVAEQGLIQGKTFRLKSITLAMQQTLNRWDDKKWSRLQGVFGLVACDECYEASSLVLMADGRLKPISDIQVGEEVAIGGRVKSIFRNWYEGTLHKVGDAWSTRNHPIATQDGWIVASELRCYDVLQYDPIHRLRCMRQGIETRQPEWKMQEASVQLRRSEVSGVRGIGSQEQAGGSCCEQVFGHAVECRLDSGHRPSGRQAVVGQEAVTADEGPYQSDASRPRGQGQAFVGGIQSTDGAVQSSRRTQGAERAGAQVGQTRQDQTLRGSSVWERSEGHTDRSEDVGSVEALRVRGAACSQDRQASTYSLQDRHRASCVESSRRVGREQSQHERSPSERQAQGLLPSVVGLEGAALPGAVRLQSCEAGDIARVDGALTVHNLETEHGVFVVGGVLTHNCQRYAAKTFTNIVDRFDCKYRVGVSAGIKRKDQKQFLITEMFGAVNFQVTKSELVAKRIIHDVEVYMVPTKFRADWYVELTEAGAQDGATYNQLLDEMQADDERNELIGQLAHDCKRQGLPTLAFAHRVEHCMVLDRHFTALGLRSGLALGGQDERAKMFDETIAGLRSGDLDIGIGTFNKLGVGHDIPTVAAGIACTPTHTNESFMDQVKGRICRTSKGKENARIYVLWDREVFGSVPLFNMAKWSNVVRVWDSEAERWLDVKEWKNNDETKNKGTDTTDIFKSAR